MNTTPTNAVSDAEIWSLKPISAPSPVLTRISSISPSILRECALNVKRCEEGLTNEERQELAKILEENARMEAEEARILHPDRRPNHHDD